MKTFDCVVALRALGEESRLRILRLLLADSRSVGEVAEELGLTVYNVSKHLKILKEAGLVNCTKIGQQRIYSIDSEIQQHLTQNENTLDLGCCMFRFDKLPE